MNKKILDYVDIFFESIPYSEKNDKIKNDIIYHLESEVRHGISIEALVSQYHSLEMLCSLAGYSIQDISSFENSGIVVSLDELKVEFKKKRRLSYWSIIFFVFGCAFLYNFFLSFHWFYLIFSVLGFGIFSSLFKKCHWNEKRDDVYSIEAYHFLQKIHDKYLKKFYNCWYFFLTFTFFLFLNFFLLFFHLKIDEMLELIHSILFYYEILIVLLGKNYFLSHWSCQLLGNRVKNVFTKNFKRVCGISFLYWFVFILFCFITKKLIMNLFVVFAVIYGFLVMIYNFTYRRKIMFQNIMVNKKRIVFVSSVLFVFFAYYFMQRDYWVLQPLINSMPNLSNHQNQITYDEESGVYTIVDADGGDFKILQLTDIHLGGSIFSSVKDSKALYSIYQLLNYAKPDFVIVTGDLTFPVGLFSLSINNHTPVMEFASFMRNLGIPWAFTYGNHDTESMATYSKEDLDKLFQMLSYKTSKNLLYPYIQPNITGRNNQLIEIRNRDGSLNQALFLIDSNAYTGEGFNQYDYIHDDQVEWYESQVLRLQNEEKKSISSMMFFHIPLHQYQEAYQLYQQGSNDVIYHFGENLEDGVGKVCASNYPSKIFDTALELGSTKAFFCGHDHYNNISLEYKGIRLTYGMSIDYLAMPGIQNSMNQRGATLITIYENSEYDIEQIPLKDIS